MDYAALPPEVNSGRMYAGAGVGSMVAASAAWDALAAELNSAAASYRSVLSELTSGSWVGPSSAAMTAAVAPYVTWMDTAAAQAQQTAGQLSSAVAAYEAAFAATVPPPQIEVNRALLASLVATNVLGQNTPAIAATEAQYSEMWAQDAAAMYGYAGASAAATRLTPFAEPQQTTNENGTALQANSVNQAMQSATGSSTRSALNTVPNTLQNLSVGSIVSPSNLDPGLGSLFSPSSGPTGLNELTQNIGNWALVISGPLFTASGITPLMGGLYGLAFPTAAAVAGDVSPADAGLGTLANSPVSGSLGNAGVSANLGESATVGKLSVPQTWADSPAIRLAGSASPLSTAGLGGVPQAEAAAPGGFFGGIPPVGSVVNAPRGDQTRTRTGSGQKVMPAMPGEQGADQSAATRPAAAPQKSRKHVASALSERERDELEKLRKEIAEVATERDAAARLIKEAML
ncbi:PPE family protein [Mycobacterium mantenii]|uniref:PPE family protein n=1 Tax=Mycobacterium mantenii TaxID=560555 RepID=A0A1X0FQR3_MYCNT|nr:PPE family protein [Mycobacterium mantenii]MCV7243159.1 PPE domain-containing protein [Mycobacterium mantenii]ORB04066.1 PPE family protein [Mycobacterium mantenii]BBY37060.1 PPE family protein [Mycobacterium mantenii]